MRLTDAAIPNAKPAKKRLRLTEVEVRNAKPAEKPLRLTDYDGLYLLVTPGGGRWWRFDYRFQKTRKTISFGTYPEVGLRDARERREAARKLVAAGVDPSRERKAARSATERENGDSFKSIALEWLEKRRILWADSHATKVLSRLERHAFGCIGPRPIAQITAGELLGMLSRVESAGSPDTARRLLQNCSQVFRHAISSDRAISDPCINLRGSLSPVKKKNFAAVTTPRETGELLRVLDGYSGSFVVKSALRLSPLVFVRPRMLRTAEWAEIDLESAKWNIPGSKMKMGEPLLVPLSRQAVAILEEIQPLTGRGKYVFPCARSAERPMSNNAILAAMRRLGIPKEVMTGHGFRPMARTLLDEELGVRVDYIEQQLAHVVHDPLGRAYNRTTFVEQRTEMMQTYADYLDDLRSGLVKPREKKGTPKKPSLARERNDHKNSVRN